MLKNRPDLTIEQLDRTSALMNQAIPGSMVTGYENLIPSLNLPDADDCHVLAAAIRCNAAVIVTFNEKDFPLELGVSPGSIVHHQNFFNLPYIPGPCVFVEVGVIDHSPTKVPVDSSACNVGMAASH